MTRKNIASLTPEELYEEAQKAKGTAIIELAFLSGVLMLYGINLHDEIGKITRDIHALDTKVPTNG